MPTKTRLSAEISHLLTQQYRRLSDALDGYYSGKSEQALNIAVTIRVLIHQTPKSHSLLDQVDKRYFLLNIFDPNHSRGPNIVFSLPLRIKMANTSSGSTASFERPDFAPRFYQRVRLSRWWDDDFVPLPGGKVWITRKEIILNVANKDGGAHVDDTIPVEYAELSKPWVRTSPSQQDESPFDLNTAFGLTAQSGCEVKEFLENHFHCNAPTTHQRVITYAEGQLP